jgi:hypothetical protein
LFKAFKSSCFNIKKHTCYRPKKIREIVYDRNDSLSLGLQNWDYVDENIKPIKIKKTPKKDLSVFSNMD